MGSPVRYACCEKKMSSWIHEKMAIQESTLGAPESGRFSTLGPTAVGNNASACSGPYL
jgi:hypothetical protein